MMSRWMVEQNGFGGILFHRKPMNIFVSNTLIVLGNIIELTDRAKIHYTKRPLLRTDKVHQLKEKTKKIKLLGWGINALVY